MNFLIIICNYQKAKCGIPMLRCALKGAPKCLSTDAGHTDMTCALLEWQLKTRQDALETDLLCKMRLSTLI